MQEIKFFGRGGQGAVTAAQILAAAAFREGKFAQTFPLFGAERRGAPVLAFVRIDQEPITIRSKIYAPDVVVIMDLNLLKMVNPFSGLKPNGAVILNGSITPELLAPYLTDRTVSLYAIHASSLAQEIYGRMPIPAVNMLILGAYCRALKDVKLDSILDVLPEYFPPEKLELNRRAATVGFEKAQGVLWSEMSL